MMNLEYRVFHNEMVHTRQDALIYNRVCSISNIFTFYDFAHSIGNIIGQVIYMEYREPEFLREHYRMKKLPISVTESSLCVLVG